MSGITRHLHNHGVYYIVLFTAPRARLQRRHPTAPRRRRPPPALLSVDAGRTNNGQPTPHRRAKATQSCDRR